jgi:hypothetical protein
MIPLHALRLRPGSLQPRACARGSSTAPAVPAGPTQHFRVRGAHHVARDRPAVPESRFARDPSRSRSTSRRPGHLRCRLDRVGAPITRGASHRTGQVLFTSGSSGRRVVTPVAGRLTTSKSSQRKRELARDVDAPGGPLPPSHDRHEAPFGEVRVPESLVDGRGMARHLA